MAVAHQVTIGIVLVNYGRASDTLACVDSLLAGTEVFSRLVITENGSPDDSWELLKAGLASRTNAIAERMAISPERTESILDIGIFEEMMRPERGRAAVVLVNSGKNTGFAGGNNLALRILARDQDLTHFWLLNNDTVVEPQSIEYFRKQIASRQEIDIWGTTLLYFDEPGMIQALCGGALNRRTASSRHVWAFRRASEVRTTPDFVKEIEFQVDYPLGASMLVSRRWLEKVGLLSEQYFLYYEELDWTIRGGKLGMALGYAPDVRVLHKEGASIGTNPSGGSAFSVRYLARSRLIFARRFLRAIALSAVLFDVAVLAAKYALRGRFRLAVAVAHGAFAGLFARVIDVDPRLEIPGLKTS